MYELIELARANGVSAYGIIMYVGFLFSGTYIGYFVGSAFIVSYHYSARNKDEIKSLLRKSVKLLGIVGIIMTVLSEIFAKTLASISNNYDFNNTFYFRNKWNMVISYFCRSFNNNCKYNLFYKKI